MVLDQATNGLRPQPGLSDGQVRPLPLHPAAAIGSPRPPHWPVPCLPDGKAFAFALPSRSPWEGSVTSYVLILQIRKLRLSKGSGQGFPAKTAWV